MADRTPAPRRDNVRTFPTPNVSDIIVFIEKDSKMPANKAFAYGDPHPDSSNYPGFVLVYYTPEADDRWARWYFAKTRENQDDYNFQFTQADIGGTKLDAVQRTYYSLRSEFVDTAPANGTEMPSVPAGAFEDTYILALREQVRSPDKELDSLFVVEVRTYVKRVPLSQVIFDYKTGRSKSSITTLYYRGESIGGSNIETLASNPNGPYWGLQAGGIFRELDQISEDWFSITETSTSPGGSVVTPSNPAKSEIVDRITPNIEDYLVHYTGAMPDPVPDYGSPHPNSAKYPGYVLTYIKPADEVGVLYEFFYAKPRELQDDYNFEQTADDRLVRTYVLPRDEYLAGAPGYVIPTVTTPDVNFPQYGFTNEYVVRTERELDGFFVMVQRVFQQIIKVRQFYDDDLDLDVTETVEIIPAGTGTALSEAGRTVEIRPENTFYDLQITQQAGPGTSGFFPRQLTPIIGDTQFKFPALLVGVSVIGCYAYAVSSQSPPAYDESYFFDPEIIEPGPGPYETQILRFLTGDPDSLRGLYPIQKIVEKRESIGYCKAWFVAGESNRASANSGQIEIPPTIHGDITIVNTTTLSTGQLKDKLPATPGFFNFSRQGSMVIGYEPTKTRYGLYMISITRLNCSGVYSGNTVPFGQEGGSTGADTVVSSVERPSVFTAIMSPDNTQISGTATPNSAVSANIGKTVYGIGTSDQVGNYIVPLTTIFGDTVTLQMRAQKTGVYSGDLPVSTFDLTPEAPTASISSDLSTVSGISQQGATVTISMTPVQQVETATVVGAITTGGDAILVISANNLPNSPFVVSFLVLLADDAAAIANKGRAALESTPAIFSRFIPTNVGDTIVLTAREGRPNDPTLNIAIDNGGCEGITPAPTSVNTTIGRGTATLIAGAGGTYSYTFDPVLSSGDILTITATDAGGASPATVVTASATPPELYSASFAVDDYDLIEGTASPGSKVVAYLGAAVIGDDVADGSGDFSITLIKNYISGEEIRLIGEDAGDSTIRSNTIAVTAYNLNLAAPTYEKASGNVGYFGVAPSDPTNPTPGSFAQVIYQTYPGGPEQLATQYANGNFIFQLEGGENGEKYAIFARYFVGDSAPVFESFPVVPLSGVQFYTAIPSAKEDPNTFGSYVEEGYPTNTLNIVTVRYVGGLSASQAVFKTPLNFMLMMVNPVRTPGAIMEISYPGSAINPQTFGDGINPLDQFTEFSPVPAFPYSYSPSPPTALIPSTYTYNILTQPNLRPTQASIKAAVPFLMVVKITVPDGRTSTTTFNRALHAPFNNGY